MITSFQLIKKENWEVVYYIEQDFLHTRLWFDLTYIARILHTEDILLLSKKVDKRCRQLKNVKKLIKEYRRQKDIKSIVYRASQHFLQEELLKRQLSGDQNTSLKIIDQERITETNSILYSPYYIRAATTRWFVDEDGLYQAVCSRPEKEIIDFLEWLTSVLLPSIKSTIK